MMVNMKKILLALLLLLPFQTLLAITPFVITDIRVEGLERLEAGTVFNYLPLKVGDELNDEEARLSIKELFDTGFFKDVALEQDGTVLVVKVVERPSISEITISGNNALETESLEQALEQVGLVQGRIFNSASLARVEQEIKNTYLSLGRYSASVTSTVEELEQRNRVAITIEIEEGRVATIKKVNIIGAKEVPVKTIIEQMSLRDKRGFRLFTRRNQYSKQKLEADIEAIRSYYLNRGFHDFDVASSSVEISPNKQNIFISISLEEGELYVFGETTFEVATDTEVTDLDQLITIEPGTPFSRKEVNASRAALIERYADEGYAFVEVSPIYETDRDAKTVSTVFSIDPKKRVYVRKIEITGNLYTRDQVIRRELRQFEGGWYSASAVSRSRSRLRRLGYFQDVTIETPSVPGSDDQVDMKVVVTERDTGSIAFSMGYSDADGALFGITYAQRNLLGTGRELNVQLNTSRATRVVDVSYVNPYHTPDGVSRSLSVSNRRVETEEVSTAAYVVNTTAAGVNYKIPIAETNSLNLGVSVEQVELETTTQTPLQIRQIIEDKPDGTNLLASFGVSRDTRDDFFFPTRGASGSMALEFAFPDSEYEYYKVNLQGVQYVPLTDSGLALKGALGIGYGDGYGDSDGLPPFRRYFAGGSNSVRGYRGRSLGPDSCPGTTPNCTVNAREPIGGDKRLLANIELLLPPFGGDGGKDKRLGLFADGGMVYGPGESGPGDTIDVGELRYSAGLVFNWFSPIGPFSMSYAEPLNDEAGDETESFQITVGTVFR